MQVSGRKQYRRVMEHFKSDSTEVDELYCEPCEVVGHLKKAKGYCVSCAEYFCSECLSLHSAQKISRGHRLLKENDMPRKRGIPRQPDMCDEDCIDHNGESIKYFCKSHFHIGCSVCMTLNHRTCKNMEYIPRVSRGIGESAEYRDLMRRLRGIAMDVDKVEKETDKNVIETKQCKTTAKAEIKKLRQKVDSSFDYLERKLDMDADAYACNSDAKLKETARICKILKTDITTVANNIETKRRNKQENKLFIEIMKTQCRIAEYEQRVQKMKSEAAVRMFRFKPNQYNISQLLASIQCLAEVHEDYEVREVHKFRENIKYVPGPSVDLEMYQLKNKERNPLFKRCLSP